MPDTDLHALDVLLKGWRDYLAAMGTPADQFSRDSGYRAGIHVCAGQLADTLDKIRADSTPDTDMPSVACQLGSCGDCPDPAECTCTCHVEDHHEDPR